MESNEIYILKFEIMKIHMALRVAEIQAKAELRNLNCYANWDNFRTGTYDNQFYV